MDTIYTVRGIGLTGRTIPRLCRRLTSRGLNLDGVEYTVYDFYTDEAVTKVKYDQTTDSWFEIVGEGRYVGKRTNGVWTIVFSTNKKNGHSKDLRK